jgi:hypothetical protein
MVKTAFSRYNSKMNTVLMKYSAKIGGVKIIETGKRQKSGNGLANV